MKYGKDRVYKFYFRTPFINKGGSVWFSVNYHEYETYKTIIGPPLGGVRSDIYLKSFIGRRRFGYSGVGRWHMSSSKLR